MDSQHTLRSTLDSVASIKRKELAKQRDACRRLRAKLGAVPSQGDDSRARVRLLLRDAGKRIQTEDDGAVRYRTSKISQNSRRIESQLHQEILDLAGLSASNVQRFLQQSAHDHSISDTYFLSIEKRFWDAMEALEVKYQYATLFSDIVTERSTQVQEGADFETVGRQEMQEQRKEWESLVFTPLPLEESTLLLSLEGIFSSPEAKQSLDILRSATQAECETLQRSKIGAEHMKVIVEGLIASDLMASEQASILKEVRNSPTWLSEMADVLNLRLASIEQWTWQTEAMPLEMRRQINGKYRLFMEEEMTQALLVYHIGVSFSSALGRALDKFYASPGWKKHAGTRRAEQAQWDYFIGRRQPGRRSIKIENDNAYRSNYFMNILPRHVNEGPEGYGDDALGNHSKPSLVSKTVDAKHDLLHRIAAELLMAEGSSEELVIWQTDFRWFGPSLSHSTIAAVMKFIGISPVWRRFIDEFLAAPMRFKQDGIKGAIRKRQRGTPISHNLSTFLGEAVLFCLDFAVNDATRGKPMYRLHDDIWMWGSKEETAAAWKSLTALSGLMGITINKEKTGAALLTTREGRTIRSDPPPGLPIGRLRWGLLSMENTGRFAIDQAKIDEHIVEMRRQLGSRSSILEYIRAYNSYMKFFALHFGKPANGLGRVHVDDCLQTLGRIHRELWPSTNGNVSAYIKAVIKERFEVLSSIPDGFLYFPMSLGGLELTNPFVALQGTRDTVDEGPLDRVVEALENEVIDHRRFRELFDKSGPATKDALSDPPTAFFSLDVYRTFRRENSAPFRRAWDELLRSAEPELVEQTAELRSWGKPSIILGNAGEEQDIYWRVILELYGEEMQQHFGSLQVVEKDLLPMGIIEWFKGRVRWES